ncbi:MAG: radical SAM family heme chaperone HemW [Chloroflexota bacterium]
MSTSDEGFGIYVHIPFCVAKCRYCDFNSYAGRQAELPRYLAALEVEMEKAAPAAAGRVARTLYLGGGTPSLLAAEQVADLVARARRLFRLPASAEVTLEANPGTVDEGYLSALRAGGVTRLSLGLQSLSEASLAWLGRIHCAAAGREAFAAARRAGFENVSLDLIYALPHQSVSAWRGELEDVAALGAEHLSLYALNIEEDTPLGADLAAGRLEPLGDDEAAALAEVSAAVLPAFGYEQYEVSNWARRGLAAGAWRSRHNLGYWYHDQYLGFGAGAHSFWGEQRRRNVSNPRSYALAMETGRSVVDDVEEIGPLRAAQDALMLGLRLVEGMRLPVYRARFGVDLSEYREEWAELTRAGLIAWPTDQLAATARGRLVLHELLLRMLPSLRLG